MAMYSESANAMSNYSGAALGMQAASTSVQKPKTISSAVGRMESLNERLSSIAGQLTGLSDMIGGPRGVAEGANAKTLPSQVGVIFRLNDAADHAHSTVSEMEDLIASIGRALG